MDNNNFIITTNLSLEIEKTNNLFQKWNENHLRSLQSREAEFHLTFSESEETLKSLYEAHHHLNIVKPVNAAIKNQQLREVENIQTLNSQNKLQLQSMMSYLRELDDYENQIIAKQNMIKQEHDNLKKTMERKLQDFAHGTKFFQMLALDFQRSAGDCMKFIFTHVDPADPLKQFYFVIFVNEHNLYQLVETFPFVDGSMLINDLNTNNNISSFVVSMRKCFVESCK
jgi:hypothetical protein